MTRRKKIYEGKAKILYEGPEPGTLIQYFKDDTTAFDATKKAVLEGKGVINNRISEHIMTRLAAIGVQNHFIRRLNLREQLIREVEIIPLEVICRNVAAGSLARRPGPAALDHRILPEGRQAPRPAGLRGAYHRLQLGLDPGDR
jgi:phosphoribosylaminoimidazole-succinocarboxamide synthase